MNKYDLKGHLESALAGHESSLKQTSYDDAKKEHLCHDESTQPVYDFDSYVKANCPSHRLPASPDAIYAAKNRLCCIEFKNQFPDKIGTEHIQNKFRNGTELLKTLLDGFRSKDCTYHFYVVFKTGLRSKYFDSRHIEQAGVRFGLEATNKELGNFYNRIITEDIGFFRDHFKQLRC